MQQPLGKIRTFGERLKTKFSAALPEDGRDYINRMQNAAERKQILIDDLLAFSKATKPAKEFVPTALASVINQVITDLDFALESKHAIISVNVVSLHYCKKSRNQHPIIMVLVVNIGVLLLGILGLAFGLLLRSYFMLSIKIYEPRKKASEKLERIKTIQPNDEL